MKRNRQTKNGTTWRRSSGMAFLVLGALVLFMPFLVGEWVIALLGLVFVGAGLFYFVDTFRSSDETTSYLSYAAGLFSVLIGVVLFLSPKAILSGILVALTLFLVANGLVKLYGSYKAEGSDRWWNLFNGVIEITLGALIWVFVTANLGALAIGLVLGLQLIVEGWTRFFLPEKGSGQTEAEPDLREHPDRRLGLEPNKTLESINSEILSSDASVRRQNTKASATLLAILLLIHVVRIDPQWSFLGFISPFSAVIGDAVVAFFVGIMLVIPLRLLWRYLTRPIERAAWNRLNELNERNETPTLPEQVLKAWVESRMRFAHELRTIRASLNFALWRILRFGLWITAVLVAINSIWGFSWYFNSENWASGVWQEITKSRVDIWRMRSAEEVEKAALSKGVDRERVFAIEPDGIASGDFSFVVIGDTGEGDASQMSLRDQLIAAGNREEVKFLVLSSDVIYPDGKMKDYEYNFYLPFKGFEKPIYAIPGNHDWFDANEGFNANFLDPESADLALRSRLAQDIKTTAISTDDRFREIIAEAARLREYYRIDNGRQRTPFFEIHTDGFSLIAVDTGILRRVDDKEKEWLEAALNRAGDNFKLVVLGHPFYVTGAYTAEGDPDFQELYNTLKRHKVNVVIAGDTHDFEYYKMKDSASGSQSEMHHFVNGGGGAYLSIGTSVGFPDKPVTQDYAFYPRTDEVTAKIRNEAPFWKMPFLFWMQRLRGWPFDQEMVSGAFDFNRAPFFQSFLEVKVERTSNQVRLLLYGVNGRLRWRDIQTGGSVAQGAAGPDEFVEFVVPMQSNQIVQQPLGQSNEP